MRRLSKGGVMRRRCVLAALGSVGLGGCLGLESPTRDGGNESAGEETDEKSEIDGDDEGGRWSGHENEIGLERTWTTDFDLEHGGRLIDGTIYVTGRREGGEGGILAVNPADGEVEWTCRLGDAPLSLYAASDDGSLYVGVRSQETIYRIDRRTGSIEATAAFEETRGNPALVDGTLVIGSFRPSETDVLVGFDARTLTERWRLSVDHSGFDGAVAADGVVVASYRNGRLSGYDPRDGDELWVTDLNIPGPRFGPFVDDEGRVIAVDEERRQIARLDPRDGSRLWTIDFDTRTGELPPVAVPFFDGETGVVGVERHVIAADLDSGQRQWSAELPGSVDSPIAAAGDTYWVLGRTDDSSDGTLYGFDAADGTLRYRANEAAVNDNHRLFGDGSRIAVFERDRLVGYDIVAAD